jgi:hypothetical protein
MAIHLIEHAANRAVGWDRILGRPGCPEPEFPLCIGVEFPAQTRAVQLWSLDVIESFGIRMPDVELRAWNWFAVRC